MLRLCGVWRALAFSYVSRAQSRGSAKLLIRLVASTTGKVTHKYDCRKFQGKRDTSDRNHRESAEISNCGSSSQRSVDLMVPLIVPNSNRLNKGERYRLVTTMLRLDNHLIDLACNFGRPNVCCKNATPNAEMVATEHRRFVLLSVVGHI